MTIIQFGTEQSSDPLLQVASLLETSGCSYINVWMDGNECVIEGAAPSYETKVCIETSVRTVTGGAVRNCLRVLPVNFGHEGLSLAVQTRRFQS